jgi:hypothetical protein
VVLGLCREHSGGVDVPIQGLACLERTSAALKAGEVHMAKEATVGALLPIRRENYQARPVFASCTCKKDETSVSITPLYRAVIDYWHEKDEEYKQRGPIDDTAGSQVRWCIRSRRAQRTACLKKKKKKGRGRRSVAFCQDYFFRGCFLFLFF